MIKIVSSWFCACAVWAATCFASEWIYWTDRSSVPPRIQRCALDGGGVEVVVGSELLDPRGIAVNPFNGKIYWADYGARKIQRADLDGGNVEDLIVGLMSPAGVALDIEGGKLYWADAEAKKIQRADLDGSHIEEVVGAGLVEPYYVAVSHVGGKVYWTDPGRGAIQRANLDGSSVEDLVTAGAGKTLRGIAIDPSHGTMYWADRSMDTIQRAGVDGSAVEDLVTTGLDKPHGVVLNARAGRVYWTDTGTSRIQSADWEGGSVSNLVDQGITGPWGIALLLDDMDGDALPDQWEYRYFGGMTRSSGRPDEDRDRDGFIDLHEYIAGTDPTNAVSLFKISSVEGSRDTVILSWPAAIGRSYTVYASTNLLHESAGIPVWVDGPGAEGSMSYTGTVSETGRNYYWVEARLAP